MLNRLAFIFCLDVALFFASQIGFALKINGIRQVNAVNFFFSLFLFFFFLKVNILLAAIWQKSQSKLLSKIIRSNIKQEKISDCIQNL